MAFVCWNSFRQKSDSIMYYWQKSHLRTYDDYGKCF
nr:MAG TPA: hypothetical protein [Caudoviricetes sp.]